jgi:hypothetical protein
LKFGEAPNYTQLLNALAPSPAERQQLLRGYFEPSEAEKEQGLKVPSRAHRVIASLVASGYVRVILTTNFDRLLEAALADVGVVPAVIATPDAADGALPLIHSPCTVIKLHGDYLDTRIKNTPEEISKYDPRLEKLIDRVLDEFGLIISGWSGEWDVALRDALTRTPTRRFTTYWTVKGVPTDVCRTLAAERRAILVPISDADSFFVSLEEKVRALEDVNQPHPLSPAMAVATIKRLLADPNQTIRLHDFVMSEVDQVVRWAADTTLEPHRPLNESLTKAVRACDAAASILMPVLANGVYWSDGKHDALWTKALERLTNKDVEARRKWESLYLLRYPSTLALYAAGLSAVETQQFGLLRRLLNVPVRREGGQATLAVQALPPFFFAQRDFMQQLEGMPRRYAPLNDWVYEVLRGSITPLLADPASFELLFDRLEILIALAFGSMTKRATRGPPGAFGYREQNREIVVKQIEDSLQAQGERSPYCESRLFGSDATECVQAVAAFKQFASELRWV